MMNWRWVMIATVVAGTVAAPAASADTPAPLACTQSAIQAALNAGGTYQLSCGAVTLDATLTSGADTTLEGPTTFYEDFTAGAKSSFHRVIEVTGGSLTLDSITLSGGRVAGGDGARGVDGTRGTDGPAGAADSGSGATGQTGGAGASGSAGTNGADGSAGRGAGILIDPGANVDVYAGGFDGDYAYGGQGGEGGWGGQGGSGGEGGFAINGTGGAGGPGGNGGAPGLGGQGGAAQGGAIYVSAGAGLTVTGGTVFDTDQVFGGTGGTGGRGGFAGGGGQGGLGSTNGAVGPSGTGITGGAGGVGGVSEGGAIYNAGTTTISGAVFTGDEADGTDGYGGTGGAGGSAGPAGGAGGDGGDARGGAILNAGGTLTVGSATFEDDQARGMAGGSGGQGTGVISGTLAPGGPGGNGGATEFASLDPSATIGSCTSFAGDTLTAGGPGAGGYGFYDGTNSGARGADGVAGTAGTVDPAASSGSCAVAFRLYGSVVDTDGAPQAGVAVTVVGANGVTTATTRTDGAYSASLPTGAYSVSLGALAGSAVAGGSQCDVVAGGTCTVTLNRSRLVSFDVPAAPAGGGGPGPGDGSGGGSGPGSGGGSGSGSGGTGAGGGSGAGAATGPGAGTTPGSASPRTVASAGRPTLGHTAVSGTSARVPVRCSTAGSCAVKLTVTTVEAVRHGKKTVKRTVTLGTVKATVAAGKSKTVTVRLNAAGRKLLAAHKRLKTQLTLSQTGKPSVHAAVVFTVPTKKKPARR